MVRTRVRIHGNDTQIVYIDGEMDLNNADALRRLLIVRLNDGVRHLVVNLASLRFIDSSGLGAIVAAMLKARTLEARVSVVVPNPRIREIFEIAGLRPQEHLWPDEESALAACAAIPSEA